MTPNTPQRSHLLGAVRADLIGPYDPESGAEVLVKPPMRWYLTGFLVPEGELDHDTAAPGDEDEALEAGDEPQGEDNPEPAATPRPTPRSVPGSAGSPAPAASFRSARKRTWVSSRTGARSCGMGTSSASERRCRVSGRGRALIPR